MILILRHGTLLTNELRSIVHLLIRSESILAFPLKNNFIIIVSFFFFVSVFVSLSFSNKTEIPQNFCWHNFKLCLEFDTIRFDSWVEETEKRIKKVWNSIKTSQYSGFFRFFISYSWISRRDLLNISVVLFFFFFWFCSVMMEKFACNGKSCWGNTACWR